MAIAIVVHIAHRRLGLLREFQAIGLWALDGRRRLLRLDLGGLGELLLLLSPQLLLLDLLLLKLVEISLSSTRAAG